MQEVIEDLLSRKPCRAPLNSLLDQDEAISLTLRGQLGWKIAISFDTFQKFLARGMSMSNGYDKRRNNCNIGRANLELLQERT